jgi:hypothetical protein
MLPRMPSGRALAIIGVLALPTLALAQDMAEAERLFRQGVELSNAERWGEAAEYFRRASAIAERPSISCNLGVALYHLGEARESTRVLERCIELAAESGYGESHPDQIQAAERFLADLRGAVGRLQIELSPPDAVVLVDGDVVPGEGSPRTIEIDPGRHAILVSATGYRTFRESSVSVLSAATVELAVHLERLPARPSVLIVESIEGARILVDGEQVGTGRVEEQLPASTVDVRVEVQGHEPLVRTVTLTEGEVLRIDASFRIASADVTSEWWFWSLLGLGVLAVAGAVVAGVVAAQPDDPLQDFGGNAGFIFTPLLSF